MNTVTVSFLKSHKPVSTTVDFWKLFGEFVRKFYTRWICRVFKAGRLVDNAFYFIKFTKRRKTYFRNLRIEVTH